MKKRLMKLLVGMLSAAGILLIIADLMKEETFTIVEKDTDTFVWIESNKLLRPTYKRASLSLEKTRILNASGKEIDSSQLVTGDKITADFKPTVTFSNPPGLGAWEVRLVN